MTTDAIGNITAWGAGSYTYHQNSMMKSKLADDARRRRNEDLRRMTPEERLAAYVRHCQLITQLYQEGQRIRRLRPDAAGSANR